MQALDRRVLPDLKLEHIQFLVIHRLSLAREAKGNPSPVPDDVLAGANVVDAFGDRGLGTGGATPYHALIRRNGTLDQMLRLSTRGAHATDVRAEPEWYNWRSVAVAIAGNTDESPPTQGQTDTLIRVVSELLPLCGELVGHTDLPGASRDPHKRCPGRLIYLEDVQRVAVSRLPAGWKHWSRSEAKRSAAASGWEF
jgi:hypothetical protein